MTAHNHSTHVEGCYRCELGLDEVTGMTNTTAREYEAFGKGVDVGKEMLADVLMNLSERMEKAEQELQALRNTAMESASGAKGDRALLTLLEAHRLDGKIDGVRLVLSYVDEEERLYVKD